MQHRLEAIWVAGLYTALTVALAWPFSVTPASSVLWIGPDTELFLWTLAWDVHAFIAQPWAIFDANIFYPQHNTLAYSENLIGSAVLAAPLLWLTGNPVLAMNVVALLSVVLCGLGTYVLARRIGIGTAGAILAGLIFAFAPPRFFRLAQLHLTTVQWMPFALAFLHGYFETGRRRDVRLAAACFSLQALSSGHGAVFLTIAAATMIGARMAFARDLLAPVRAMRDLGVAGALLLAPAALVIVPYRIVQAEIGLRRPLADWATSPASFLASPAHLPSFVLSALGGAHIRQTADAFLFPGYLSLLLAMFVLVPSAGGARAAATEHHASAVWHGRNAACYLLMTTIALLICIGPPLGIWPLVYWLPGFNFIRVPSRFSILALLGLALLAGMGFDRLRARLRPGSGRLLVVAFASGLVAEFAAVPLTPVPYRLELPAVDRWLALQSKPFAVAEMPPPGLPGTLPEPRLQTQYMLHSTAHWQKTVHGQSGIEPPLHRELYSQLLAFPDESSLRALARFGVRYVVVHEDLYPPNRWSAVAERIRAMPDRLKLEYRAGPGRVYSVR